ncbi:MAG: hypothetical protein ACI8Z1_003316 [Candidatus Azotimanducaceae bacterium]|jgi:hypothetical protein
MSDRQQQRPNLLCIGAPKCGTTWLSGLLAAHSQTFIPPQKELNVLHCNDCAERLSECQAYFKNLSRCLEHFPREQLLVVDYRQWADLSSDMLRNIPRFLNVKPDVEIGADTELRGHRSNTDLRGGVQPIAGLAATFYPRLYRIVSRGPLQWFKRQFGVKVAGDGKRKLHLSQLSQKLFFPPGYPKPNEDERAVILANLAQDQKALKNLTRAS